MQRSRPALRSRFRPAPRRRCGRARGSRADYRGEIQVLLINHGAEPFAVTRGMRIAQLVVAPVARIELHEVAALGETPRGTGGFGSTGASSV